MSKYAGYIKAALGGKSLELKSYIRKTKGLADAMWNNTLSSCYLGVL